MLRTAVILTAFAGLLLVSKAEAGRLVTPPLFEGGADNQNICVAINVGNQPIDMTVELIDCDSQV